VPIVNMRELARSTSKVVGRVSRSKKPTFVTRSGHPVAVLMPIDEVALEDWVLANAPEFVDSMREGDLDAKHGRTVTLDDYAAKRFGRGLAKARSARGSRRKG
jgi:prevent-host-death family protein